MATPPATTMGHRTRRQTGPERRKRSSATNPTNAAKTAIAMLVTTSDVSNAARFGDSANGFGGQSSQPKSEMGSRNTSRLIERMIIAPASPAISHLGWSRCPGEDSINRRAASTRS